MSSDAASSLFRVVSQDNVHRASLPVDSETCAQSMSILDSLAHVDDIKGNVFDIPAACTKSSHLSYMGVYCGKSDDIWNQDTQSTVDFNCASSEFSDMQPAARASAGCTYADYAHFVPEYQCSNVPGMYISGYFPGQPNEVIHAGPGWRNSSSVILHLSSLLK